MPAEPICGGTYHLGGHQTISLPVSPQGLPTHIHVEGQGLVLKSKFHVSLVCTSEIARKHNVTVPDFTAAVVKDFCDFSMV